MKTKEIGEEEKEIVADPIEDPMTDDPAPAPEPDREVVPEREKVEV